MCTIHAASSDFFCCVEKQVHFEPLVGGGIRESKVSNLCFHSIQNLEEKDSIHMLFSHFGGSHTNLASWRKRQYA